MAVRRIRRASRVDMEDVTAALHALLAAINLHWSALVCIIDTFIILDATTRSAAIFDICALSSDIRRSSPRRWGLQESALVCTSQFVFLWWYRPLF